MSASHKKKLDKKMLVAGSRDEIYQNNVRFFFDKDSKRDLTRWILVRHGETGIKEFGSNNNISPEEYSIGEVDLNEHGIQQAQKISQDLQNLIFDKENTVFVISPLKRVAQTIAPFLKQEFNYDILNDPKYQEIFEKYKELHKKGGLETKEDRSKHIYKLLDNLFVDFRITQYARGNTYEGVKADGKFVARQERVEELQNFVQEMNEKYQGKTIVVLSHGAVLHTIRKYWNGGQQVDKQSRGTIKTIFFDKQKPYQVLTKIILVRHGRTDYNEKHLGDSLGKAKLTDFGRQQTQNIAKKFSDTNIDVVYSSPLERCLQTIKPLADQKGLKINEDSRLKEIQIPKYQDKPFDCHIIKREDKPIDGEKGESIIDVYNRVRDFLEEIINKHQGQTVVVCSHGDPLVLMRKILFDFDYNKEKYKYYIDNKKDLPVFVDYVMIDESKVKKFDLHKPWIDYFLLKDPETGKTLRRMKEVLDPWMDSASMPYAQVHYPFENKEKFEKSFPADYIAEYTGQIRAWFYVMHVLGVALFDKPAYTNVVCTGVMNGNDGRKMSKSYGNYPDPVNSLKTYGGDAIRLAMLDSPIVYGGDMAIKEELFVEKIKKFLLPFWNAFYFFTTYANIDKWHPYQDSSQKFNPNKYIKDFEQNTKNSTDKNFLDLRIVSEVQKLIQEVDYQLSVYNMQKAVQPIEKFLDNLTNWYIRRSRRRFWKSENDKDKQDAYETLYYVLLNTAKVFAPFAPFLSEYIWLNLTEFEEDN